MDGYKIYQIYIGKYNSNFSRLIMDVRAMRLHIAGLQESRPKWRAHKLPGVQETQGPNGPPKGLVPVKLKTLCCFLWVVGKSHGGSLPHPMPLLFSLGGG